MRWPIGVTPACVTLGGSVVLLITGFEAFSSADLPQAAIAAASNRIEMR